MREVVHIAQAASVALSYEDIETIPSIVATLLPDGKTSMLQDIEAGRRTELESFAGTVLELGRQYGVDTPINHMLYRLIRAKEQITQRKPLQQENKFTYEQATNKMDEKAVLRDFHRVHEIFWNRQGEPERYFPFSGSSTAPIC